METTRDTFQIPWLPLWVAGRYYSTPHFGTLSTGSIGASQMYATPIYVPNPAGVTVTTIGLEVTVAGTAGHLGRLSIYRDLDGYPDELILDAGTIAMDPGAATFQTKSISQYLAQGWYWMAVSAQSGTVRTAISNSHFTLMTRTNEGSIDNNSLGITSTPAATTMALWTLTGHPEVFPSIYGLTTGPVHTTFPRVMLGV